jgi:hypothetical protein
MLAATIIESLFARGIKIWTDGDNLKAYPSSALTDEDRRLLKCYKTELLWRISHPEGDPDTGAYMVSVGDERLPLSQLIAEGREIVEREGLHPKTKGFDPDMWAASVALRRREGRG